VQSFDHVVTERIGRRQDPDLVEQNLTALLARTSAHVHSDLVAGLPGETLEGFAAGFDRLHRIGCHEIQVGILKRLRGAPIARHDREWGMIYDPDPPYELLENCTLSFSAVRRVKRLARYLDLVLNSGNFPASGAMLMDAPSPFWAFMGFSDWLHSTTGQTHGIARDRLARLVARYLIEERHVDPTGATAAVGSDCQRRRTLGPGTPPRQRRHLGRRYSPL
jgi:hypothetical protein